MNKSLTMALVVTALIVAGYAFGVVCAHIGEGYALLLSPSSDLLVLLVEFLIALAAVAVAAGLVAVLLRPLWLGFAAFALSTLALVLGWEASLTGGLLAALYLLAGAAYVVAVDRELNQRLRFSVHPVVDSQSVLRLVLIFVACAVLYLGTAPRIQREGFSIPDAYLDPLAQQMEKQVVASVPQDQRAEAAREFRKQFRSMMDGLVERTLGQYQRFLPALVVSSVFMSLVTIVNLLAWVPGLVLQLLFSLFVVLGVTKTIIATCEVERITLA